MNSLDDFDDTKPIWFSAFSFSSDELSLRPCSGIIPIYLSQDEAKHFLAYCYKSEFWRQKFEENIHSHPSDIEGEILIETWLPLNEFRFDFCCSKQHVVDLYAAHVLIKVFDLSRGFLKSGCDCIYISGFRKVSPQVNPLIDCAVTDTVEEAL